VFSTAEAVRYVFLKKGERFTAVPVETGIADVRRVQILSGINIDDEVALTRPLEFDGEIPVPPPTTPGKPRNRRNSVDPMAPQVPAAMPGKAADRAAKTGR
jgi:hypothetical protein